MNILFGLLASVLCLDEHFQVRISHGKNDPLQIIQNLSISITCIIWSKGKFLGLPGNDWRKMIVIVYGRNNPKDRIIYNIHTKIMTFHQPCWVPHIFFLIFYIKYFWKRTFLFIVISICKTGINFCISNCTLISRLYS